MKKIVYFFILILIINTVSGYRIMDVLDQAEPVYYCGYELEAVYISDSEVKFRLNNETSKILGYHDLYRFREGSSIYVREILEEEAKEGPDKVSVRFYPRTCVIEMEVNVTEDMIEEIPEEDIDEVIEADDGEVDEVIENNITKVDEVIIEPEKIGLIEKLISWIKNLFK